MSTPPTTRHHTLPPHYTTPSHHTTPHYTTPHPPTTLHHTLPPHYTTPHPPTTLHHTTPSHHTIYTKPSHPFTCVYLNCCSTAGTSPWHSTHLKWPSTSSGCTGCVRTTWPLMRSKVPIFPAVNSRTLQYQHTQTACVCVCVCVCVRVC